ncbi:MAG: hypothetical protein ACTHOU_04645, partial [Aureliella sp.]
MTLWEVDVLPADGQVDTAGQALAAEARDLGLGSHLRIAAAHGFLLAGNLDESDVCRAAAELLSDPITEQVTVAELGDARLLAAQAGLG